MKMWSMKLIVLLLFCYACLPTESERVFFKSKNFYNFLHWVPAKPDLHGEKVLYSVEYKRDVDEQQYQIKTECQNITALTCDLTHETPSHPDVQYLARVLVNNRLHGVSIKFKPLANTTFGPPSLLSYTNVSSLHVNVTLPLGPNGVSLADIIRQSKNGPFETVIVYILNITHPKWAAQVNISNTSRFIINLKNNRTEYCGYVVYKSSSEWGRPKSEKAHFCARLKDDHLKILPWLLVGAALPAVLIIIAVIYLCYYVKGGKKKPTPKLLVTPFGPQPGVINNLDENLKISKPKVYTQREQTIYAKIQVKPNVPSDATQHYFPQDTPCRSFQGSVEFSAGRETPNPEDTSGQSSDIYSVVAVHVPAEESKDGNWGTTSDLEMRNLPVPSSGESWDKVSVSPRLPTIGLTALPPTDPDSYESREPKTIFLATVRDPNGELMLPSLTLQLLSNTGERERKLQLSDLRDPNKEGPMSEPFQSFDSSDWTDSGCDESIVNTPTQPYCNTSYFQSKPDGHYIKNGCSYTPSSDATGESGYKQNWMPETLGMAPRDSCSYRRVDNPWPWTNDKLEDVEEDEEQGIVEGPRQILLGGWGSKIQE